MWAVLRNSVTEVNQKTVRKVLKDNNLKLPALKHRVKTKKRNLFHPHGPDQIWQTDITYIPTESGMTYLMCIKDYFMKEWQGMPYVLWRMLFYWHSMDQYLKTWCSEQTMALSISPGSSGGSS